MVILGDEMNKAFVINKVLKTLLTKQDNVDLIIEETKDLSTMDFDQLVVSLTSYAQRFLRIYNIGASEE